MKRERGAGLQIKRFEATEFWKASTDVLEGGRGDAVRKARAAEIFKLREEREDVLNARADGADPVREAAGEEAADDLTERAGPAGLGTNEHAPVDAQVRDGGEKSSDGAEGREAVAELDRQPAHGRAIDVLQVRREVARKEEEVAERLKAELRVRSARRTESTHEGEVGDREMLEVGERALP